MSYHYSCMKKPVIVLYLVCICNLCTPYTILFIQNLIADHSEFQQLILQVLQQVLVCMHVYISYET